MSHKSHKTQHRVQSYELLVFWIAWIRKNPACRKVLQNFAGFIEKWNDREVFPVSVLSQSCFETIRNSLCFGKQNSCSRIKELFHYKRMHNSDFLYASVKPNGAPLYGSCKYICIPSIGRMILASKGNHILQCSHKSCLQKNEHSEHIRFY